MSDVPPHAELSGRITDCIDGRKVVSALFLTYKFDPAFFELEVLPLLFSGASFSHATAIRAVQLDEQLRTIDGEVAVYYDAGGLISAAKESAKLDVRRIPIAQNAIFHPKNVLLLVERSAEDGVTTRSLIVASMSANLTRAGWWENVEACHIEELAEGDKTMLREDLLSFLAALRRRAIAAADQQRALDDIVAFLRRSTEERSRRFTGDRLHTRFFWGAENLLEFLHAATDDRLRGAYLEVISPYFDLADESEPLKALIDAFEPKETRVFLPRGPKGAALCPDGLYEMVRNIPNTSWCRMPKAITRVAKRDDAPDRFVHAKVYRFFHKNPAKEYLLVGSANLTRAAHQRGGNFESGFLVERSGGRPDFWLEPDRQKPKAFEPRSEADEVGDLPIIPLALRYDWTKDLAEAMWLGTERSRVLAIRARAVELGSIGPLEPKQWIVLPKSFAAKLRQILSETSFIEVQPLGGEAGKVLVSEEGMGKKPSLLLSLSIADILRYWSLLTPAQRTAFIAAKWPKVADTGDGSDLVTVIREERGPNTFFDRFAGFFHAFSTLEREVRKAMTNKRVKDVHYRIFGSKYDSLPTLVERIAEPSDQADDVERYVIVLCALQLIDQVRAEFPEFWTAHREDGRVLDQRINQLRENIRASLAAKQEGLLSYLEWFDRWFLKRTKALEVSLD